MSKDKIKEALEKYRAEMRAAMRKREAEDGRTDATYEQAEAVQEKLESHFRRAFGASSGRSLIGWTGIARDSKGSYIDVHLSRAPMPREKAALPTVKDGVRVTYTVTGPTRA